MVKVSDSIKGHTGPNPFSDSQARNFADMKVIREFYPISQFWTLFNDQHEILLGTRGSGKTFLLKMMRYSMLKRIESPQAQKLVSEKEFIAIYVPMHLEFVAPFKELNLTEDEQIQFFQIGFNCKLAEALITELSSILEDIQDPVERAKKMITLVEALDKLWFGESSTGIYDLVALSNKIVEMYYSVDWRDAEKCKFPAVFRRQICAPLLAAKMAIRQICEITNEPTWIVCIDEAEFLNETMQRCINNVFRSDSNRIALKVATLPYYHKTLETLVDNVSVADGNDFSFRVVDLNVDSEDFIELSNKLCSHRMRQRFDSKIECPNLESFLGKVGNDAQIDYYRLEVGEDAARKDIIEKSIIDNFAEKRKENAENYTLKRKTIYDKYAPIFFVREMYKMSRRGNSKPGWYAGAQNVRKLSQGNPRIYIQIMNDLFEKARKTELTAKVQHEVMMEFANRFCDETQALEIKGPVIYKELKKISQYLHRKVHEGYLRTTGVSFYLKYQFDDYYVESKKWLEKAIAYSRIMVDNEVKICGIKEDTKFMLANIYAIAYWLPMRTDTPEKIMISENEKNLYLVKNSLIKKDWKQLSLFDEETYD